ncbi:hypothetical protein APA_631 [Pseudanabaena sp. lw0831]|nr:hypothetical protein APA_631 [Pseudanabaena sp. lw0831]
MNEKRSHINQDLTKINKRSLNNLNQATHKTLAELLTL